MGVTGRLAVAFTLVASWFVLAPSQAGSATEPEITDPSGDGLTHRDIVKVWFEPAAEEPGNVSVTMTLGAAPAAGHTTLFALHERWNIWFVPTAGLPAGMKAAYISFTIGVGTSSNTGNYGITGRLGFTPTIGTFGLLSTELALTPAPTLTGTTVKALLPFALLKGFTPGTDSFTSMYANVVLTARGPVAGDNTLNTIFYTYDRAPNSGNGKDYLTVGSGPAGASFNVSVDPATLEVSAGSDASAAFVISNVGTTDANLTLSANASEGIFASFESANVSVPAGTNLTVNVTINASADAANASEVHLVATDGAGTFANATLMVTVVAAPMTPTTNATGNTTQNETAGPAGADDRGVPGFGTLAAVSGALVIALRRRRDPR